MTRLPTLPRLAVQRIFFQSALVLFAGRGSGGFGFGELGRFRGILFAARRFFLLAVCLRSSGFALGELTHSLFGHALFFGKAQRFRIRLRNRRRRHDRLVKLHEGALLAHFDADRLGWRATATPELQLGGLLALERDATRFGSRAAASLLLPVIEQRHLEIGRE